MKGILLWVVNVDIFVLVFFLYQVFDVRISLVKVNSTGDNVHSLDNAQVFLYHLEGGRSLSHAGLRAEDCARAVASGADLWEPWLQKLHFFPGGAVTSKG